jgi:hypothetical protein
VVLPRVFVHVAAVIGVGGLGVLVNRRIPLVDFFSVWPQSPKKNRRKPNGYQFARAGVAGGSWRMYPLPSSTLNTAKG